MARNRVYVGNIPYNATEEDLGNFFDQLQPTDVVLIYDRETKRPKGFAFVEFGNKEDFRAALALHGQLLGGRAITVREAHDKPQRRDA